MPDIIRLSLGEGSTIQLTEGDITRQTTDAIVNAANSTLMGGGGVDGAIHYAGGPAILEECKKIVQQHGQLLPGKAVVTTGGRLKAGHVIHTVGPIWRGGALGEAETLASAYRESLKLADKLHLHNIAFPSISTGAYAYPLRDAAEIALNTVAGVLPDLKHTRDVTFVLYGNEALHTYARALEALAQKNPTKYRLDRIPI